MKERVPHGHFKRRFSHKRKRFFGTRLQVFDRLESRWIYVNRLKLDYALECIVQSLPTSSRSQPATCVSLHYVTHGHESWERDAYEEVTRDSAENRRSVDSEPDTVASRLADYEEPRSSNSGSSFGSFGGFESGGSSYSSSFDSGSSSSSSSSFGSGCD